MKRQIYLALIFLLLFSSAKNLHAESIHSRLGSVRLHEINVSTGYSRGDLIGFFNNDLEIIPIYLQFGFKINSLLGLEDHRGTLQMAIEPFILPIIGPDKGISVGVHLTQFKYSYPLFDKFNIYGEFGSGPMYHGVNSFEQGDAGFNFHSFYGGGLQYLITQDKSLNLGYRLTHISNAGTRSPNGGINTNEIIAGFSLFY